MVDDFHAAPDKQSVHVIRLRHSILSAIDEVQAVLKRVSPEAKEAADLATR